MGFRATFGVAGVLRHSHEVGRRNGDMAEDAISRAIPQDYNHAKFSEYKYFSTLRKIFDLLPLRQTPDYLTGICCTTAHCRT